MWNPTIASSANLVTASSIRALRLAPPLPAHHAESSFSITVTLQTHGVTHVWASLLLLPSFAHPEWSISELSHPSSQESRNVSPWLRAPSWLLLLPAARFNGHQTICASELKVSWRLCQILPFLLRNAAIPCSDGPCANEYGKVVFEAAALGFFCP